METGPTTVFLGHALATSGVAYLSHPAFAIVVLIARLVFIAHGQHQNPPPTLLPNTKCPPWPRGLDTDTAPLFLSSFSVTYGVVRVVAHTLDSLSLPGAYGRFQYLVYALFPVLSMAWTLTLGLTCLLTVHR